MSFQIANQLNRTFLLVPKCPQENLPFPVELEPSEKLLSDNEHQDYTSFVVGLNTYSERNRLRERLVAPKQAFICCVAAAKPQQFNHPGQKKAGKN